MSVLPAHCSTAARHGTTYARQERRLNTFHLRIIRRILGISWQDKVNNADVLYHAGLPSMHTLLIQLRLRWLGHVRRMEDGCIPKYIVYGELGLAAGWRNALKQHLKTREDKLMTHRTSEHTERRTAAPSDLIPITDVLSATKTATPALPFSVISDAAKPQQEINKNKNKHYDVSSMVISVRRRPL